MLSRLEANKEKEVEINFIYNSFQLECIESNVYPVPGLIAFIEHLKVLYPDAKRTRKINKEGKNTTVYAGICMKSFLCCQSDSLIFADIHNSIPQSFSVTKSNSDEIQCEGKSDFISNGHQIYKKVIFHNNGSWDLSIGGKNVDLKQLYIDNTFQMTSNGICLVFDCVQKVQLCSGVKVTKSIIVSRYHTLDSWQKGEESPVRSVRSLLCLKTIPLNAKSSCCKICQKMTFSQSQNKENVVKTSHEYEIKSEKKSLPDEIKKIFPEASENMIELLIEQAKNIGRHPKGRRWSQKILGVCLQLYNRNPHCYEMFCASKMLVLPSKSLLILYKNTLKQSPGFEENIFEWMHLEANRQNIPLNERYGGIIFDEMSIQADIEIDKNGDLVELAGFTDYGSEGDLCHALKLGSKEKGLGKYVLQLLFLGTNGFRFPFAHFLTNGIQASELYGLFWKAIYLLFSFGFKVLYTCMDGAQSNRSFMHICLGDNPKSFVAYSPCTSYDVIFLMDISHVIKKLRNNILKSGYNPKCTRILTLPSLFTVQWQMFRDMFLWDQQNALQIHRKLTGEHFNLDSQMKMRNNLAEEVLNTDMLHAMKMYQKTLGEKGQVLNGAIELLEQTSKLIDIFRDMRPIKSVDDSRLVTLKSMSNWFKQWSIFVQENKDIPAKEKSMKLLSPQCCEDIQSCIQGFVILCSTVLHKSSTMYITPALINSDIVENVFNQQRSTYHGANTNPNALQYKRAINSVLVGQSVVSKKSNVGKATLGTMPYSFLKKQPLKRRHEATIPETSSSKPKVIRM